MFLRLVIIGAILSLLLTTTSALAAGEGAGTTRDIFINEIAITPGAFNPCTGGTGKLTRTFTGFVQQTTRPDGTFHWNALIRADDVQFISDSPAEWTYTGREQVQFSANTTTNTLTMSFSVRVWLDGTDGTSMQGHIREHLSISADGKRVEFEKPVVICR